MSVRTVKPVAGLDEHLPGAQFIDAYCIVIDDTAMDARRAAERMFGNKSRWIDRLMALRNAVVAPFGLKSSGLREVGSLGMVGLFPVVYETPSRIVAGFNDKHLDFRVVVDVCDRQVTASTLVRRHNLLGRVYLGIITPFHRVIVRSMLKKLGSPS